MKEGNMTAHQLTANKKNGQTSNSFLGVIADELQ